MILVEDCLDYCAKNEIDDIELNDQLVASYEENSSLLIEELKTCAERQAMSEASALAYVADSIF